MGTRAVRVAAAGLLLLATAACAGCGGEGAATGAEVLTVWTHAGTAAELAVLEEQVRAWDASRPEVRVQLQTVPEGQYVERLQAAAVAGELPDLLDIDGPLVSSFAHQGALAPLDGLLPAATVEDALPSLLAQGTWDGDLYALGAFESGLSLFADASALRAAHVRIPEGPEDAWSGEEFGAALAALARRDPDRLVFDTKRSYGPGEWSTYGFGSLLASAGASLLDPVSGRARGALDSPAAVGALTRLQQWHRSVDPDPTGDAFVQRRVPLSWVGHWEHARYAEALGRDLRLVPLPDLGHGARATTGSWAWAVSAGSPRQQLAADLLADLLATPAVLATTAANGAVPGTRSALAQAPAYSRGGALHLYARQLLEGCDDAARDTLSTTRPVGDAPACVGVQRPRTPAYPVLTAAFAQALESTLEGGDPAEALRLAAATVDAELDANADYRTH